MQHSHLTVIDEARVIQMSQTRNDIKQTFI